MAKVRQRISPRGYPAVADFTVTTALAKAAAELSEDKLGKRYHVGVVHSKDSFYGEVEPDSMPVSGDINYRWNAYLRCGCMTSEMECAAVFSRYRKTRPLWSCYNSYMERGAFKGRPRRQCERRHHKRYPLCGERCENTDRTG